MTETKQEKFFTKKLNVILLAVLCMALWGSTAPVIKVGFDLFVIDQDEIVSKILFAGLRFVIAGVCVLLVPFIKRKKIILPNTAKLPSTISIGLVQTTLQMIFFFIGLSYTTGFKASVMAGMSTFFSVILAHFMYKDDRLNFLKGLGCVVGFAGVLFSGIGGSAAGANEAMLFGIPFMGDIFVMLSMLMFAVSGPMCKEASKKGDMTLITGYSMLIGGIILVLIGALSGGVLENVSFAGLSVLFYVGALSAVATTIWNMLLKYNNVSAISVYNCLQPVFGALLSAALLGENVFQIKNLVALILSCAGIYLVNKAPKTEVAMAEAKK